jgi:hypothetical protein
MVRAVHSVTASISRAVSLLSVAILSPDFGDHDLVAHFFPCILCLQYSNFAVQRAFAIRKIWLAGSPSDALTTALHKLSLPLVSVLGGLRNQERRWMPAPIYFPMTLGLVGLIKIFKCRSGLVLHQCISVSHPIFI